MSTTSPNTQETSVMFSLGELERIEEERVREEESQRAHARREGEQREKHAEEQRRSMEAARIAAAAAARRERERDDAEAAVRRQAREQASIDVLRIEAEGKARLAVDNAARAHELAVLHLRNDSGRRRLRHALAAVVALMVCGGSAAAYGVTERMVAADKATQRLRDERWSLAQIHEQAMTSELAALDRRYEACRARANDASNEARAAAGAARSAIEARGLDHERLGVFRDALDAWQARLETVAVIASLDGRHAVLVVWAAKQRKTAALEAILDEARRARARAHEAGTSSELVARYDSALGKLLDTLARDGAVVGRQGEAKPQGRACSDPNDPICDGKTLLIP